MPQNTTPEGTLPPIFISAARAAELLSLTRWSVYQLLDAGLIESRYHGTRRLVRYSSLLAYADSLPTERESA